MTQPEKRLGDYTERFWQLLKELDELIDSVSFTSPNTQYKYSLGKYYISSDPELEKEYKRLEHTIAGSHLDWNKDSDPKKLQEDYLAFKKKIREFFNDSAEMDRIKSLILEEDQEAPKE